MSTINNIISLLQDQHKSQKDLTDFLGISKNAFTDWKSGRIKSYAKYLPEIAEYLNVSVDYLLGKEQKKEPVSITYKFDALCQKYDRLSAADKKTIDDMFDFLLSKPEYSEKENVG